MSVIIPRPSLPRQRAPIIEHEGDRSPALGYEAQERRSWIRCLAHGYPTPLARWHFHEEFELHLITATSGRAFVGDWTGAFQPGHLVLCGSLVPHNWISDDMPEGGVAERDLVIQFRHEPLLDMAEHIPEFREVTALLDRARHGIEFFGLSEIARAHWHAVHAARGIRRVMSFLDMLTDLAQCSHYRLLSATPPNIKPLDTLDPAIASTIHRITSNVATDVSLNTLAAEHGMSESRFSRLFQRATGSSFTDFVNQQRIHQACHLLQNTDRYVNDICFQVGFNNLANFNRRFRAIKGMTPTEFRRQAASRYQTTGSR